MGRIKIEDIPKDRKIGLDEMKKVMGGLEINMSLANSDLLNLSSNVVQRDTLLDRKIQSITTYYGAPCRLRGLDTTF